MKTLLGMVTIGRDTTMRSLAADRAQIYARKHGYEFMRVNTPIIADSQRTPHWEKTLIPQAAPGYERYLIIDDDVLINHRVAPALPEIPANTIGLVREALPGPFTTPVQWVGNTGFMLVQREAVDLLTKAYSLGEYAAIPPGFGDQPAINAVAWKESRVTQMDWNWNYIIMADWLIHTYHLPYPWTENRILARIAKATLSLQLLTSFLPSPPDGVLSKLRSSYMVHLTWYRIGARLIDKVLG